MTAHFMAKIFNNALISLCQHSMRYRPQTCKGSITCLWCNTMFSHIYIHTWYTCIRSSHSHNYLQDKSKLWLCSHGDEMLIFSLHFWLNYTTCTFDNNTQTEVLWTLSAAVVSSLGKKCYKYNFEKKGSFLKNSTLRWRLLLAHLLFSWIHFDTWSYHLAWCEKILFWWIIRFIW